jgi:predicted heme/steroid binding protein
MELTQYSKQQLALRNGQDNPEIWVALNGLIYDEHWAGQDLTEELKDSPHTETVFEKFSVIGVLK